MLGAGMIAFAHSHRNTGAAKRAMLLAMALASLLVAGSEAWAARCDEGKDPITISPVLASQMNYGTIVSPNFSGAVTLSPSGAISAPGFTLVGGGASPGKFTVTGKPGCAVTISFSGGVLFGPGTATMTLSNFTSNPTGTPTLNQGALNLAVGASLNVNANQPGGTYSGTYTVTVIY
jgi:Domain of unknown function (DUF4402)